MNRTIILRWLIAVCMTVTLLSCAHKPAAPTAIKKSVAPAKQLPSATTEDGPPSTPQRYLEYRYFLSVEDALLHIVSTTKPRVIGFGEYHNQEHHTVTSALKRFITSMLPTLSQVTSDIVVEALVPSGNCGQVQTEVAEEIEEETERPEQTEDEVMVLFRKAREHGIVPHYLELSCADHERIYGEQAIDYMAFLELIGNKLLEKTTSVMGLRARSQRKTKPLIAVYGGAIHNDATPASGWRTVSFAWKLKKLLPKQKYVEVDLLVPEIVSEIDYLQEEEWYPLFQNKVSAEQTLLIKRSETNFMIVFPKETQDS